MNPLNDRNKIVTVKACIPPLMSASQFEVEFMEWLKIRGYEYKGLVEVMYEEEQGLL